MGIHALTQELTLLAEALGYQRIVYMVDPDQPISLSNVGRLDDLFSLVSIVNSPQFLVVAVLRDDYMLESNVVAQFGSRLELVYTDWTADECHNVAVRHICQALPNTSADSSLSSLMTAECRTLADSFIKEECGRLNPAAWVSLAETMLFAAYHDRRQLPLTAEDFPALRKLYFARHVRIRLDTDTHVVWRGPRPLHIDSQSWHFLQLLSRRHGNMVSSDDKELLNLAGSQTNVHSLASRARRAIEPDLSEPIFLFNRRGYSGGYWLEKCD